MYRILTGDTESFLRSRGLLSTLNERFITVALKTASSETMEVDRRTHKTVDERTDRFHITYRRGGPASRRILFALKLIVNTFYGLAAFRMIYDRERRRAGDGEQAARRRRRRSAGITWSCMQMTSERANERCSPILFSERAAPGRL